MRSCATITPLQEQRLWLSLVNSISMGCFSEQFRTAALYRVATVWLTGAVCFASQAVPPYISEMAPPSMRGALNILFQLATTIGIFVASLIN